MRDYGTAEWEGGDKDCVHSVGGQVADTKAPGAIVSGVRPGIDASRCKKCGATRIDQQIGLERTPEEFVGKLVQIFREVQRVLAPHGTCWINIGDSYAGSNRGGAIGDEAYARLQGDTTKPVGAGGGRPAVQRLDAIPAIPKGLKPKDLVGIPWRLAFALQNDGWYLRSDIIWSKMNPMPESVRDRPTKSHEYIFLLTKNAHYYYDQEAVREPAEWHRWGNQTNNKYEGTQTSVGWIGAKSKDQLTPGSRNWPGIGKAHSDARHAVIERGHDESEPMVARTTKNIRSVWNVVTEPFPDVHFACFPREIVRRALLAGCPERVCRTCGQPSIRLLTESDDDGGWSDCHHNNWRPGRVLDPFIGSGTTALVAREHARHAIGIELSEKYAEMCARRLQQLSLFADG